MSEGHSAIHARLSSTHKNTILMAPAYNNISAEIWNAVLNLAYFFPLAFHRYFISSEIFEAIICLICQIPVNRIQISPTIHDFRPN